MLDFGFYNRDCMEGMKEFPDKYFDLAIVDPPYGGGATDTFLHGASDGRFGNKGSAFEKYRKIHAERSGGTWAAKYGNAITNWDIAPGPDYFEELERVSKNQIIWGGNYFDLPPTRCFLILRKSQVPLEGFSMAPVEYAWTSFNRNAAMIELYTSGGSGRENRFHPTQKPVELYTWILNKFAQPGDKILDTHVGSASSLIACHRLGFQYVGFELDEVYFNLARDRLEAEKAQISLFD